ncbi:UNVERIFIED_CONTAM: AP2 domain transcription factor AP2X-1 [Hammondia hammondi]|eukprot:XP_008882136.1 AP2 domain transcription factor AP2X-1 [Hammondia hammondi]
MDSRGLASRSSASADLAGSRSPCTAPCGARPSPRHSLSPPPSEAGASPVKGPDQTVVASAVAGGPSACALAASPPESRAERVQVEDGQAGMRKTNKAKGEEGGEETERWTTQAVEQEGALKPACEETAVPGVSERSASAQQAVEGSCGLETPERFFGVSTGTSQGSPSPEGGAGEEARPERENSEKSATGGSASTKAKKPIRESARRPDTALMDRHLIMASPSPSSARRSSTCSPSPHSSREGEDKQNSGPPPASSPSASAGALEPAEKGTLCSGPQDVSPALPASSSNPSTGGGGCPLSPPAGQAPRPESGAQGSGALSLRRSLRHRQPVRPAAIAASPLGGQGSSLSSRSASPTRRGGVSPCGSATAVGKGPGATSAAAAVPAVGAKAPPSASSLAGFSGRSLLASVSPPAAGLGPGAPGKKKAGQVQGAAKARGAPPFVLAEYWSGVTLDEMEKGEVSWARAAAGLPLPASPHKVPGGPAPPLGGPPARDEDGVAACAGEKGKEKACLGSGRSQAAQGLAGIDAVAAACWGGAGVDSRVLAPPAEGEAGGAFGHGGEKKKVHASSDSSGGSRAALGGRASFQGKARKPAGWEEERGRREDRSRGRRDETDGPRFDVTWFVDDSQPTHTRKRTRWDSLWVRPASPVRVAGDSAPEESPERRRAPGRAPDLEASMTKRLTGDSGLEQKARVELGFASSDSDDCDGTLPTAACSSLAAFAASKTQHVPRCCYCLLPRRLPGRHAEAGGAPRELLGWSNPVETEETRGRYLRLYCSCTKRPFGESVLQGAAGRRGLLLPVATNALLYSVRRVALDGVAGEQKGEALPTTGVSGPTSGVRACNSGASGLDDACAEAVPGAPAETIYRWRDPCTLQTFSSSLDRIQGSLAATAAVAAAAESAGKPVAFLPRLYWDSEADCYIASCLRWEEEAQPTPAAERGEKRNSVERPADARERDEKKPGDPSVPGLRRRSLKLLQKKFSVAFLGDAKAHFYASEWLKWQHKGQRTMDEEDRRQEVARQMLLVSPLLAGRKAPAKAPGGCSKKASSLSAAQLALESGRPLTPEEEAELKRQLENKERQKKQKLLRQQWRRQQAREAKLRLREAEAAAAAAAAAGAPSAPSAAGSTGASQTRSPQSQQKSASLPVLRSKTEALQPSPGASFAPASSRSTLPAGDAGAGPCEGVGTRRSAAAATSGASEKVTGRKSETARDSASASLEAAKSTMVTRGGGRGSSMVAVTRSTSSPSGRAASVASSTLGGFGAR